LTDYFHKRSEDDHYYELIDQWLRTLILGLATLPEKRMESDSLHNKLQKVKRFIDESTGLLSLSELSTTAGLSLKYFGKMFSHEFGIAPQAYMRKKILARSLALLSDTDMTLEEIAGELGYSDSYSYSKAFRKVYGISPGKVRK
jgi:AraC-like DNA-binding protein